MLASFQENGKNFIFVIFPCKTIVTVKGAWDTNTSNQRFFSGEIQESVDGSDIYWKDDPVEFTVTSPTTSEGVLTYP